MSATEHDLTKRWITTGAAATMLGISAQRVGELVDAGELDGYRPTGKAGRQGHRRVSVADVLARLAPATDPDGAS